jgi:hypothetical protein
MHLVESRHYAGRNVYRLPKAERVSEQETATVEYDELCAKGLDPLRMANQEAFAVGE